MKMHMMERNTIKTCFESNTNVELMVFNNNYEYPEDEHVLARL